MRFGAVCCRPWGCAGAGAHLEKTGFRVESVANFACRPFSRGGDKTGSFNKKPCQKQLESAMETEGRRSTKQRAKMSEHGAKLARKTVQNCSEEPLGRQVGPRRVPKVAREALETLEKASGRLGKRVGAPQG